MDLVFLVRVLRGFRIEFDFQFGAIMNIIFLLSILRVNMFLENFTGFRIIVGFVTYYDSRILIPTFIPRFKNFEIQNFKVHSKPNCYLLLKYLRT